jgi:hypothetical protein
MLFDVFIIGVTTNGRGNKLALYYGLRATTLPKPPPPPSHPLNTVRKIGSANPS